MSRNGTRYHWVRVVIAFCWLLGSSVVADVRVELQPEAIRMGESAQLRVIVEGAERADPPTLPDVRGLRITGPGTETSHQMTMVNGRMEQRRTLAFRYSIIPLQPGEYSIGPITVTREGQTVELPEQTLRVVMPSGDTGREDAEITDYVFATLQASREQVFVNESLTLTLSIYSREVNLGRDMSLMNMPESGLQLGGWQERASGREVIRDDVFDVRRFQAQVRPFTSGTIEFAPELRVQILVQRARRQRGFFDDPFFSGVFSNTEAHPFELQIDPVIVAVRPLPEEGRPDDFTGGVGQFQFETHVHPTELQPGDPLTVTIRIEGEGNMDTVGPPSIPDSEWFRVHPPRVIQSDLDRGGNRGRKVYEQVVIPRTAESRELPALSFSYFDPQAAEFRTITRGPYSLSLLEVDETPARRVRGDATAAGATRIIGEDIAYLHSAPRRWQRIDQRPWYQARWFLGAQAIPPLLVLGMFLRMRRQKALSADVARMRRDRAPRSARAGLAQAEKGLRKQDTAVFFEGFWKALSSYFGDRLNLSSGAVTSDAVIENMRQQGLAVESLKELERIFAACDQRRFANVEISTDQMSELMVAAKKLLKQCEKVKA